MPTFARALAEAARPSRRTLLRLRVQNGALGIDLSVHNGLHINWDRIHRWRAPDGRRIVFAYLRASGGTWTDESFRRNAREATRVGITWGPYIAMAEVAAATVPARSYLDQLLEALRGVPYGFFHLPPMMDVEKGREGLPERTRENVGQIVHTMLELRSLLARHLGRWAGVYSGAWWHNVVGGIRPDLAAALATSPHWSPTYDGIPGGDVAVPYGFPRSVIKQYMSHGSVDGISGDVDMDVFEGGELGLLLFSLFSHPWVPIALGVGAIAGGAILWKRQRTGLSGPALERCGALPLNPTNYNYVEQFRCRTQVLHDVLDRTASFHQCSLRMRQGIREAQEALDDIRAVTANPRFTRIVRSNIHDLRRDSFDDDVRSLLNLQKELRACPSIWTEDQGLEGWAKWDDDYATVVEFRRRLRDALDAMHELYPKAKYPCGLKYRQGAHRLREKLDAVREITRDPKWQTTYRWASQYLSEPIAQGTREFNLAVGWLQAFEKDLRACPSVWTEDQGWEGLSWNP